jgi:heme/copper-type cytochrome/quinol oxidase subunit 2
MGKTADPFTVGLGWLVLIVAVIVFVSVEVLLVVAMLRMRRGEAAGRSARPPWVRVRWGWELLWTLLPALGLLALGLLGAQAALGGRPATPPSGAPTPVALLADRWGPAMPIAKLPAGANHRARAGTRPNIGGA